MDVFKMIPYKKYQLKHLETYTICAGFKRKEYV
jgi:hypothetical protein